MEIIFYSLLVLFLTYLVVKIRLNYQISVNFLITALIFSLIYFYYRGDDQNFFYSLQSIPFLYYSDVILLLLIFSLFIAVNNIVSFSSIRKAEKGFLTDAPLKDIGEDLYNREEYAKKLANKINNTYSSEALAVGINGEWGIGKTSFIDLLKRYIEKQSFILVDFNPWGSINEENIILNFFNTLKLEVKKYSTRLSSLIFDYSNSLAAVYNNNVIKSSVDILSKNLTESLDFRFKEINDLLKDLNKRIIIFIDDLDRLQKGEIIQVIKLIRNTANFNNTIFVVAYDRNYICGAF